MNIAEMHVWFRQYAQQMGMQNVRAILPEQIDILINSSITDTINQVITQNIGVTNDRIISDNSKIGQINALRSLYKVITVNATPVADSDYLHPFIKGTETHIERIIGNLNNFANPNVDADSLYFKVDVKKSMITRLSKSAEVDSFEVVDTATLAAFKTIEGEKEWLVSLANNEKLNPYIAKFTQTSTDISKSTFIVCITKTNPKTGSFDYLYLVDLSINFSNNATKTNYFPIRLIDDAYLADTLNDFVLRPRLRTPIAVLYNDQLDIYLDELVGDKLPQNLNPDTLRVSYIAKPNKVCYAADLGGENIDCNLPEYMHVDILKHAVDLYRIAVSGALSSSQQQQEAQQREDVRNNYRNDNNQRQ